MVRGQMMIIVIVIQISVGNFGGFAVHLKIQPCRSDEYGQQTAHEHQKGNGHDREHREFHVHQQSGHQQYHQHVGKQNTPHRAVDLRFFQRRTASCHKDGVVSIHRTTKHAFQTPVRGREERLDFLNIIIRIYFFRILQGSKEKGTTTKSSYS
mmetsp:Transcript_12395/g.19191  ORF Transcript_12395/g.19191 Transcript_12395/m.19191 type:complete len:153 (+) Transcript_12395:1408-1866(+)